MSGSNEAGDRSQETETGPAPAPSAPPSFGKAEPSATGATDTGGTGEELGDLGPLPVEIRLPISLQKPWWADDGEDIPTEHEPPSPTPEAEARPTPGAPPAPEAEAPAEEPPGTLVAGTGVPNVDSRRAVPREPIADRPRPTATDDTDPDGFPPIRPDDVQPAADEEPDAPAKVLTPDSILPPGTTPPQGATGDTEASKETRPQVIASLHHVEGGFPDGNPQPPQPGQPGDTIFGVGPLSAGQAQSTSGAAGGGGRRKVLLLGGGVAALAVLVGIAGFAIATGDSDSTTRTAGAAETPAPATPSSAAPSQAPSSAPAPPSGPSMIDSARTDRKPLALTEAFPASRVNLGGRAYARDRSSVNHQCALVARGAMATALSKGRCSSVVRVTFLDRERSLAVTSGVAVLPTKAAALAADQAGDPSKYEWFRGMPGKRTPDIDRAGGYAASTVRGRYIVYAYATYANGKPLQPDDTTLRAVAEQFVGYALRPIDTRARG